MSAEQKLIEEVNFDRGEASFRDVSKQSNWKSLLFASVNQVTYIYAHSSLSHC